MSVLLFYGNITILIVGLSLVITGYCMKKCNGTWKGSYLRFESLAHNIIGVGLALLILGGIIFCKTPH